MSPSIPRIAMLTAAIEAATLLTGCVSLHSHGPAPLLPEAGAEIAALELGDLRKAEPDSRFLLGVEAFEIGGFREVWDKSALLVTGPEALAQDGRTTLDVLHASSRVNLARVAVVRDSRVPLATADSIDRLKSACAGVPNSELNEAALADDSVWASSFEGIGTIVYDVPLTGLRWTADVAALRQLLVEAAQRDLQIVVLDRPPLASAQLVDGPLPDNPVTPGAFRYPMPIMHGLTTGELAHLLNDEYAIQARLTVVPMRGWQRGDGGRWVAVALADSQNEPPATLRDLLISPAFAGDFVPALAIENLVASVHPGVSAQHFVESTGDTTAILLVPSDGNAHGLLKILSNSPHPGLRYKVGENDALWNKGQVVRVELPSRGAEPPSTAALGLVGALCRAGPSNGGGTSGLYGTRTVLDSLQRGVPVAAVAREWEHSAARADYDAARKRVLLYEP